MLIFIKVVKERKDIYLILTGTAVNILSEYYKKYKSKEYLSEGVITGIFLSKQTVERYLNMRVKKANIKKDVSVYDLRHSFAIYLLENRIDLRYI